MSGQYSRSLSPGYALKHVDAGKAGLELVAAELFAGLFEGFGDPALPVGCGLRLVAPPRCSDLPKGGGDTHCPKSVPG
jgi:hypothetical protein